MMGEQIRYQLVVEEVKFGKTDAVVVVGENCHKQVHRIEGSKVVTWWSTARHPAAIRGGASPP